MSVVPTCKRLIRTTNLCFINFFYYQAEWYICKYNFSFFDIQTLNPQDSLISFQMCPSAIILQSVWVPNLYLHHDYLQGFQNQDAMPNLCPMPYHAFVFVKSLSFACHHPCQACLPCHHQAFSLCHVIFPRPCPSCPLLAMFVMSSLQPLSLMCCCQ